MKGGVVHIRRATPSDAILVASVLRQAFAEFEPSYTQRAFAATIAGTDAILARMEEGPVWCATSEGRVLGTAAAVQNPDGIYVRGMAVIPAARGRGVGQLLLREIETFAAANHCLRLYLSTTPFLLGAIRLYERFGFQRIHAGPHDLFGTPLFTMEKRLLSATHNPSTTRVKA